MSGRPKGHPPIRVASRRLQENDLSRICAKDPLAVCGKKVGDGEYKITIDSNSGVVKGELPRRALRHILEWYELHKEELALDWALCRQARMPKPIDPLE